MNRVSLPEQPLNRKSLPRKTPGDILAAARPGRKARAQNAAQRPGGGFMIACHRSGQNVTPKNPLTSFRGAPRHTMGELAPDGRDCLHPIVPRVRTRDIATARIDLVDCRPRSGGSARKTRPAGAGRVFRQSIRNQRLPTADRTASGRHQLTAAWYFSTTSDGTRPRADTEMPCA